MNGILDSSVVLKGSKVVRIFFCLKLIFRIILLPFLLEKTYLMQELLV